MIVITNKETFHIIWCTYASYPVWDNQGNWNKLKERYEQLRTNGVHFELNRDFPQVYSSKISTGSQVRIDIEDFAFVKECITQLTSPNGDRIAGDLQIICLNINETFVELIVEEMKGKLNQKLSRLKSRLATLMHFERPEIYPGKKTWGKGIWISTINSKVAEAIKILDLTTS